MEKEIKVFGAALDAADFPLSIQTKLAYLSRLAQNLIKEPNFLDPYESLLLFSRILPDTKYTKIGKFPIESWLTPKPNLEDYLLINQLEFQKFANKGAVKKYSEELENYLKNNILPHIPLMIGVDHSLTGGVLNALSKEYGSENLLILIFDAHFDGLPSSISINLVKYMKEHPNEINPLVQELIHSTNEDLSIKDSYTCASFLFYLIEEKVIMPENLIIFGCQDYPNKKYRSVNDPRIVEFVNFYNKMEQKGVNFIPKTESTQMIEKLNLILKKANKSNFYISLDVDIGALKEVIATRFRNAIGIDQSTILHAARIVKNNMDSKKCKLIGLDVMEIETHLLNKVFPKSGRIDKTIEVVDNFLEVFI